MNRRTALAHLSGSVAAPRIAFAATSREISWDDLIPPGLPYAEVIGEGELDEANDAWNPIYDANAINLNEALDGVYIKMPGYIIPLDISAESETDFMLVPCAAECLHTPPPPANQLDLLDAAQPLPGDQLLDPVWVKGTMSTQLQSARLGQTGYSIAAGEMGLYIW